MKYSAILVSFLLFILVACKKEKDSGSSPDDIVRIKELNYSIYQNYSSQFVYSGDGKLQRRITKAWYEGLVNPSYDTTEFEYSGKLVSSIRFSPTSFTNLNYDSDGNIIRSEFFNNGTLWKSEKYLYDMHILREIQDEKQNSTIRFSYDVRGNLSTKTYYSKGNKVRTVTLPEYDDKPNPFKGNQLIFAYDGFNLDAIDYFSNNNPLKREIDAYGGMSFSYNYIYNGDGFWTRGGEYSISYN